MPPGTIWRTLYSGCIVSILLVLRREGWYADLFDDELDNIAAALDSLDDVGQDH